MTELVERELTTDEKIDRLTEKMDEFISIVNEIKNQIEPTLDALKSSAIGKMFGM